MSKLDNIILECANKVLDGKEETLGAYIDPTKQQIKDLFNELLKFDHTSDNDDELIERIKERVEELEP